MFFFSFHPNYLLRMERRLPYSGNYIWFKMPVFHWFVGMVQNYPYNKLAVS